MLKLSATERETIISRCDDESCWTVYTCSPPMIRKLSKLSQSAGIPIKQIDSYGYEMKLPVKAVRISMRKSRKLSEKEIERRKERGKILGARRRRKSNIGENA